MEQPKRPVIDTGNGAGPLPILANDAQSTVDPSRPSPKSTKPAEGSTKPVSIPEALSLLQTLYSDLRLLGCETAILAKGSRLYAIVSVPASIGPVAVKDGHITLAGVPVSEAE